MKVEFSGPLFKKYSNTKFYENSFSVAELFLLDGWTDTHDEANSHFSQFCEDVQDGFLVVQKIRFISLQKLSFILVQNV